MIKPTNIVASLTDFIGLQDDLTAVLMCEPRLRKLFMVQERKLMLDSTLQVDAIWQTKRNGGVGQGIIIEVPRPRVNSPGVPGPIYDIDLGFVVMEERNLNTTPNVGTGLFAEQTVQIIHDVLHHMHFEGFGTLEARGIDPANDWIDENGGIWALRAKMYLKNPRKQTGRVGPVAITIADGLVTLACAGNPEAQIFYTTDLSTPASDATINPLTQLYSAPIAVDSGDVIRAAAYQEPFLQSPILKKIIP